MSKAVTTIGILVCLVVLVACSSPAPTGLALNYSVSGCDEEMEATRSGEWGEVEVTIEDGAVHMEQKLVYVCCAELALTVKQEGNTVKVMETNIGELCRCICEYHVEANIADLAPGTYRMQVWGVQYKDVQPLELLGEAMITL